MISHLSRLRRAPVATTRPAGRSPGYNATQAKEDGEQEQGTDRGQPAQPERNHHCAQKYREETARRAWR